MAAEDVIPLPQRESAALEATVRSVVSPGATLTGNRRRELAMAVRDAADGQGATAPDQEEALARHFTNAAHTIRAHHVSEVLKAGMTAARYVEILSLAARVSAVDTICFGLGVEPVPFPAPIDGPPTDTVDPEAQFNQGWVPTVGPASPPNALSLLPHDDQAMHQLHGALYLSIPEMAETDIERGLHRTQMELVAARTSLLNECFFWLLAHAGMLRVSARKTGRELDLRAVVDPEINSMLPHGAELLAFTDAAVRRDRSAMGEARHRLADVAGAEATVRAAAVAGNFQMMNRLLDAIGVRVGRAGMKLAIELELKVPQHLHP